MELVDIAKEVRKDILLEVFSANSGHPGGALSCADILTAIYFHLIQGLSSELSDSTVILPK